MQTESFPFPSTGTTDDGRIDRWVSLATAGALIAYGITRKSKFGVFLTAASAPLVYRGVTGEWPHFGLGRDGDTREGLSGAKGIHVRESIRLEAPVEDVFAFWRRFEN